MDRFYKWLMVDTEVRGSGGVRLLMIDVLIAYACAGGGLLAGITSSSRHWTEGFVLGVVLGMLVAGGFNLFIGDYAWTYYRKKREKGELE